MTARPFPEGFPRTKVPAPRRAPHRSTADRCDTLFSLLVRREGRCLYCAGTQDLECAHGFPRRYLATRWDFRNGFCLCHGCHRWFTERPLEWETWLKLRLGASYDELRFFAQNEPGPDVDDVIAHLRTLARAA